MCTQCGCNITHLLAKFDFPNAAWVWTVECDRGHTIVPTGKDDKITITYFPDA